MNRPAAGDRISEYILLEKVGAGSFGEVWKARHHIWEDQIVAIKIATDAEYVRNLQQEGVTIHGLRHPNIVRAIGLDPYAAPPYLVMEFVDGPSLQQVVEAHPEGLPFDVAVSILRGMLQALEVSHEYGVVHRDIKPANVLIASRNEVSQITAEAVRVTDFGLGKAEKMTTASIMQSGNLRTEEGQSISGTIAYMAPEQRDGLEVDARTDLYACVIVFFEMVTGKRPQGADRPRHIKPDLPTWVDDFFSHGYTARERRFASAREMLAELDKHTSSKSVPRVKPVPPVPTLPRAQPVTGASEATGLKCPACGGTIERDDNFCIHCGHQVNPHPRRCIQCGAYPDARDQFCISCGGSLRSLGC